MATGPQTLLAPGLAEWEELDAQKRATLRPPPTTTVAELLRRGISLSSQAARLRRAVHEPDEHGLPAGP